MIRHIQMSSIERILIDKLLSISLFEIDGAKVYFLK